MNVEKSIKKGKIIYSESFWDKFWTILLPLYFIILLLFISFTIFINSYQSLSFNLYIIIASFSVFILSVALVIIYLKIDNLSVFKGKSRTFNKKLVLDYVKDQGYYISNQSNDFISIDIKVKFFAFSDYRYLTVLFNSNKIFYNCVTFENINAGRFSISNFKSPLYWFANKKCEKIFRNYLQENSTS